MFKNATTITMMTAAILCVVAVAGCQEGATTGTTLGALLGAGVGQLAGGDTEATLIGAAVGAGAGYIFGNESDKEKTQDQIYAVNEQVNSRIVNVTNSNGSIIQVRLRRQGVGWIGTRGEYYPTLPTAEQLRPVYGF